MKILKYSCLMLSLSFSAATFSLGLGAIHLHSYLGQPLDLEIDMVDIGSVVLSSIHAELGSYSEYQQLSLDRPDALVNLSFVIERNYRGKPVIHIRSLDPINEPYFPFLIDLAWPKGQLYKVYHVLLDPPGYEEPAVVQTLKVKKVFHVAKRTSEYGPTQPGETIWQIAQRIKGAGVTLQQLILAIVATNEDAFKEGNLNGLKQGQYLQIPSNRKVKQIPADPASLEVSAHDRAWTLHEPVSHVINPPYFEQDSEPSDTEISLKSEIVPIPKLKGSLQNSIQSAFNGESNIALISSIVSPISNAKGNNPPTDTNAKIGVATTTIESLKEMNSLLKEQLANFKKENNDLKQKLILNQKKLEELRTKVGQASSSVENDIDIKSIILMLIVISLLIGSVLYLYHQPELWTRFIRRRKPLNPNETPTIEFPVTNTVALETLLNLAQSYYDKKEYESSKHALLDVLKSGTDEQKQKAQALLDKIAEQEPKNE